MFKCEYPNCDKNAKVEISYSIPEDGKIESYYSFRCDEHSHDNLPDNYEIRELEDED